MSIWRNSGDIKAELISDGWLCADTYDKHYSPVKSGPAVYLFLLTDAITFDRAFVAYVGMSENLKQRLCGHSVLSEITTETECPMRWFKPLRVSELRSAELGYIRRFDPPWNIQGRRRGVVLT